MTLPCGPAGVNRLRDVPQNRPRAIDRRGREMPQRDVKRLGSDVLHREIRDRALEPRVERGHDGRMFQSRVGEATERFGQLCDGFGDEIEAKRFDRNETIPLRFIRPKDRTERAAADLMQDAKWTERGWRGRAGGFFERQLLELREN